MQVNGHRAARVGQEGDAAMLQATLDSTTLRKLGTALVLAALGLAGNVCNVPVAFTVAFTFGSIFTTIALATLGPSVGLACALAASSYTWVLWNHPYAMVGLVGEAIWLALWLRAGRRNLVVIDTAYWLFIGAPLVIVLYTFVLDMTSQQVAVIALKQSVNGVFNTLIASLLLTYDLSPARWWRTSPPPPLSLATIIFHLAAAFLMVPTLGLLLVSNARQMSEIEHTTVETVLSHAHESRRLVRTWLDEHQRATTELADLGLEVGLLPSSALQSRVHEIHELFPDFLFLYLADANGTAVAVDPPNAADGYASVGTSFADRPYVEQLRRTHRPVISDALVSRGSQGTPTAAIASPAVHDGALTAFGVGAVNLERMREVLNTYAAGKNVAVTVLDAEQRVVASTQPEHAALVRLEHTPPTRAARVNDTVYLERATDENDVLPIRSWGDAHYVTRLPIAETPWTLRVEASLAPAQAALYDVTITNLAILVGLFLAAVAISQAVSRELSRTPAALCELTHDIPKKVLAGHEITWPTTRIAELSSMVDNFRELTSALGLHIQRIRDNNLSLEQRVQERTAELNELTATLAKRVEQETKKRQTNEQILVQQSKLAAMGQMTGAIAHEWRQPLTVLGLVVQNIRDAHANGELDGEYLERSVQKSLLHIRRMSRTIDDFRGFFQPDRERTAFDTMRAVGDVLSLFAAQLAAHGITYRLTCHTHGLVFDDQANITECKEKTVVGFRNEFEHVIMNLINNAREAILERQRLDAPSHDRASRNEPGHIDFDFSVHEGRVILDVRDNGCGIEETLLGRVFDPYVTTKSPTDGMGLGLYMAKVIIEGHMGGAITAANASPGARFTLSLPRAPTESPT